MSFRKWLSVAGLGVMAVIAALTWITVTRPVQAADSVTLLNVSYDPTRELYESFNTAFVKYWKAKTGQVVRINQSHGGSGRQARAVIDGLPGDVVTLALGADIDSIAQQAKLLPLNWESRLPNNSAPYTSTIVFLVRKGNPKGSKDWADLAKPGMQVITPNPRTSGGARWNYLAAWAWATRQPGGNEQTARAYLTKVFKNVPVLDTGARAATTTFVQRGIGDVLLAWENEALLAMKELGPGKVEIVVPSISVLAEPSVTVVDKVVLKHGTREVATEYLKYLYSKEGQEIVAKNYYRPRDPDVAAKYAAQYPKLNLVTIQDLGGWAKVQQVHFAKNGIFEQISSTK